jgi:Icc-related predicted phosphoesterase
LTAPVLSAGEGFVPVDDVESLLDERPTLEVILAGIAEEAPSLERAILVCHAPPLGMGLANVDNKTDVGSVALSRWIQKHQPLLTLHGHIHESPMITGVHTAKLGRTTVHQPGQCGCGTVLFSIISFERDEVTVQRKRVSCRG